MHYPACTAIGPRIRRFAQVEILSVLQKWKASVGWFHTKVQMARAVQRIGMVLCHFAMKADFPPIHERQHARSRGAAPLKPCPRLFIDTLKFHRIERDPALTTQSLGVGVFLPQKLTDGFVASMALPRGITRLIPRKNVLRNLWRCPTSGYSCFHISTPERGCFPKAGAASLRVATGRPMANRL